MNTEEAQKLLILAPGHNAAEVEVAASQLIEDAVAKRERAPTPQLKAKFSALIERLESARHALLLVQGHQTTRTQGQAFSPLSQTQMADLPRAQATTAGSVGSNNASGSQWGGGAVAGDAAALKVGQLLAGRYEIREQVGTGGMGAVYRAFDKNRDKDIAIKVLLPHLLNHAKAVERFVHEARLSSEMSHPHIVNVFDVQQDGGFCFLTMELLQGQNLRQMLQARHSVKRTLSVNEAVQIASQVADALAYAHEKTVHRDIKPENIWLTEQGSAKVMDFGIARLLSNTQDAKTQMGVGTAYYMAPEQLVGAGNIDGRADQYALAVMVYEMLAGNVPMGRMDALNVVRKDVPRHVSEAVDKALSARPDKRFANMQEFRQALLGLGQKSGPNLKGWMTNPRVQAALAIVVLAAIAPFVWQYFSHSQQLKQDYSQLDGQTHALQKQVDTLLRDLESNAATLEREQDKLQGELRQSANAESTARLRQIKRDLPLSKHLAESYKKALNAEDGSVAVEGFFKSAEASQRASNYELATQSMQQARQTLQKLLALPAAQREQDTADTALLDSLSARWSIGPCDQSKALASVRFDGRQTLFVEWNGGGDTVAETLSSLQPKERFIETRNRAGDAYRYSLTPGGQLDVLKQKTSEHTTLTRCS